MRWFAYGVLLSSLAWPLHAHAAGGCRVESGMQRVPLVELYTAEGCSDCPPADKWLSGLAVEQAPDGAIPLAMHVDYWDAEGWPDRFADAAYTKRQDFRLHLARKKVRYTPQVMIGEQTGVDWRDPRKIRHTLSKAREAVAPVALTLEAVPADGKLQVRVGATPAAETSAGKPDLLWLAMYQDDLTSEIAEGENKGRTLHHDRVARALHGPWGLSGAPVNGTVDLPLPAGKADLQGLGLVLFAESSATGDGLQALELVLDTCRN